MIFTAPESCGDTVPLLIFAEAVPLLFSGRRYVGPVSREAAVPAAAKRAVSPLLIAGQHDAEAEVHAAARRRVPIAKAARAQSGKLFQPPPRRTRRLPESGPCGSSTGERA